MINTLCALWTKRGGKWYWNPKHCKTTSLDGFKLRLTLLLMLFSSIAEYAHCWHHSCCSEWMLPRIVLSSPITLGIWKKNHPDQIIIFPTSVSSDDGAGVVRVLQCLAAAAEGALTKVRNHPNSSSRVVWDFSKVFHLSSPIVHPNLRSETLDISWAEVGYYIPSFTIRCTDSKDFFHCGVLSSH